MARAILFLTLINLCSGVKAQPTLTQPSSESVSLSQTVRLSCTASGGGSWYHFPWYQQRPGQAPRFLHCPACSNRGDGIPDRFAATKSGDVAYLSIVNVQPGDEADYYCAVWEDRSKVSHSEAASWGSETETWTPFLPL